MGLHTILVFPCVIFEIHVMPLYYHQDDLCEYNVYISEISFEPSIGIAKNKLQIQQTFCTVNSYHPKKSICKWCLVFLVLIIALAFMLAFVNNVAIINSLTYFVSYTSVNDNSATVESIYILNKAKHSRTDNKV